MNLFRSVVILGSMVLANLAGCSNAAREASKSNSAPVVQNITLAANTGPVVVGTLLFASYTYFDTNNDAEATGGSSIQWLRDGATIPGATGRLYTLRLADAGKTVSAEVTPLAQTGSSPGLPVVSSSVTVAPANANVALNVSAGLKQLHFSWTAVTGATYYRVSHNPDGASGFTVVSADLSAASYDWDISVHRINWPQAQFLLEACDADTCLPSASISALNVMVSTIGYFKAGNTGAYDYFGAALALSADGNTLALGAYLEDSAATGVGGNQTDGCTAVPATNCAVQSGAVYVYTRANDGVWLPQPTYVKASNTGAFDKFGYALALSADGNTLAVGAYTESSAATGVGGNQTDGCTAVPATNCARYSGAVYVYTRANGNWSPQPTYVKASNTGASDYFGYALALSADGNTLAVGAYEENSTATGVGGNQSDGCTVVPVTNCAAGSGAVYVYTRANSTWLPQSTYVKASNTGAYDQFGYALALSADGNTLAVGASGENSAATGMGGKQTDGCTATPVTNCAYASGAVYVYTRANDGIWLPQPAYVKASNTGAGDNFGYALALSADGNTLAVGALGEDSAATGLGGNQANGCTAVPATNCAADSGAVYVYARANGNWSPQPRYVKASNAGASDHFGSVLALSADGNTLAVGASGENSAATGMGGNQTDGCTAVPVTNCAADSGAVYVYTRTNGNWSPQPSYVKTSNTGASDYFGYALALSADGNTLAVGANWEDSAATGVGGNQIDGCATVPVTNCAKDSGAVYLY